MGSALSIRNRVLTSRLRLGVCLLCIAVMALYLVALGVSLGPQTIDSDGDGVPDGWLLNHGPWLASQAGYSTRGSLFDGLFFDHGWHAAHLIGERLEIGQLAETGGLTDQVLRILRE